MTGNQQVHEARRRAARQGKHPAAVPDVLVTCDAECCRDDDGHPRFVRKFRWSRDDGRWEVSGRGSEVHLRADDTPSPDAMGWGGSMPVRDGWDLRCTCCEYRVEARDAKLQAAFGILQRRAPTTGTIQVSLVLLHGMLARLRDGMQPLP